MNEKIYTLPCTSRFSKKANFDLHNAPSAGSSLTERERERERRERKKAREKIKKELY